MIIERYEHKYFIDKITFDRLFIELQKTMVLDEYLTENYYYVNSMYFDDFNMTNYVDKIEGQFKRKKVRIRTYNKNFFNSESYFGEIKNKKNLFFFKNRIKITKRIMNNLFYYNTCDFTEEKLKNKFFQQFFFNTNYPVCLVRYKRIPLVGKENERFRVSFDFDLETSLANKIPIFENVFNKETIIFEIKFNKYFPKWLNILVKKHNLFATSISKYCLAIDAINKPKRRFV